MFTDGRSKRVVFLAHCFLNQNAISDGTAVFPAAVQGVIRTFLDAEVGIVQLPCPELCCLGLDRGDPQGAARPVVVENTRIRRTMEEPEAHQALMGLVDHVMGQIKEYEKNGFEIVGIVGANRSPNCGVESTSDHDEEISGRGIFMEELSRRLEAEQIKIPMLGLKGSDPVAEKLKALLRGAASEPA